MGRNDSRIMGLMGKRYAVIVLYYSIAVTWKETEEEMNLRGHNCSWKGVKCHVSTYVDTKLTKNLWR